MAEPQHALTLKSKGQGHAVIICAVAWVCRSIRLLMFVV